MMIAVQTDHQYEFDSLWHFAKTKMQLQSGPRQYLFAWHTDTSGNVLATGVAPDGDQWIAAALSLASDRWGDGSGIYDYGQQAEQILHAMWHESDTGGVNLFDATSYLPIFSPPFTFFDGTPYMFPFGPPNPDGYPQNFQEDAWRVIANANIDALWFGGKPWQTQYSNTLEAFFESQGVFTYVSRYHLDGTPLVNGQNTYEPAHAQGLVAMNSASAISATGQDKKAFLEDFWNTAIPSGKAPLRRHAVHARAALRQRQLPDLVGGAGSGNHHVPPMRGRPLPSVANGA
jgi:oligosaccharide reducing-end xylanase